MAVKHIIHFGRAKSPINITYWWLNEDTHNLNKRGNVHKLSPGVLHTLLHQLKLLTVGAWTGVGWLTTSNGFVDFDGCGKLGMDCKNGRNLWEKASYYSTSL